MTEQNDPVQPERTQEPTQSTEDAVLRLTGVPKTPEELEAEREAAEEERRTRFQRTAQPAAGTASAPSDHPHGGPPGQTGEHPLGGPPGQTGEQPGGGPPPHAETLPTEETDTTDPEAQPKAP
jgi:hypothetical protein